MRVGNRLMPVLSAIRRFRSRASQGEERLWKVWWFAGIPVGGITSVLLLASEHLRGPGGSGWADVLDVSRFLVYLVWFQLAWRCSRNVERAAWTRLARGGLAAGLVFSAMF
jgi:hypothetical protein